MNGQWMLYVDQHNNMFGASTIKELKANVGSSTARRMYVDKKDGPPKHVGYIVGSHWLTAYVPYEGDA